MDAQKFLSLIKNIQVEDEFYMMKTLPELRNEHISYAIYLNRNGMEFYYIIHKSYNRDSWKIFLYKHPINILRCTNINENIFNLNLPPSEGWGLFDNVIIKFNLEVIKHISFMDFKFIGNLIKNKQVIRNDKLFKFYMILRKKLPSEIISDILSFLRLVDFL